MQSADFGAPEPELTFRVYQVSAQLSFRGHHGGLGMSNNLDLSQIASNQLNKHVTANDRAGELDGAVTEPMAVPIDDTNAVTLTAAAFRRHSLLEVVDDTTPPDGAITLTVPTLRRGVFPLRNTTAHPVTVTISGQPADPPVVLPDEVQLVVCNGTDVLPAGSTQPPYDLLVYFSGTQDDGHLLVELVFVRDVAFGAQVRVSVRRIKIAMASTCSYRAEYHLAYLYLRRASPSEHPGITPPPRRGPISARPKFAAATQGGAPSATELPQAALKRQTNSRAYACEKCGLILDGEAAFLRRANSLGMPCRTRFQHSGPVEVRRTHA